MLIVISQSGDVYANPESVEIADIQWEPSEKHFVVVNASNPDGKTISGEIPEGMEEKAYRELKMATKFGTFQPNIVVDISEIMKRLEER
jgi:hypothetical protein